MATKSTAGAKARDVMTANPTCVGMGTTVRELAELLVENEISGAPVIDPQERVIGVVSKTDLLNRCLQAATDSPDSVFVTLADGLELDVDVDPDELGTVEEFMSTDPVTASPDEPITALATRMTAERIHRIVVVDAEHRVKGIVTSLDLLKAFAS